MCFIMKTYNFAWSRSKNNNNNKKKKKIRRTLEFNQSELLKPYIEFNTKKSEDKDWKEVCKLMNNAIDQKTKENLRNRINVEFVNNEKNC